MFHVKRRHRNRRRQPRPAGHRKTTLPGWNCLWRPRGKTPICARCACGKRWGEVNHGKV